MKKGETSPRQMHDVSSMGIKCASCGVDITELPFVPSADRPVYCKDCNMKRRPNTGGGPRPMHDVSNMGIKCASCGVDITELPFVPSADRPVYCKDCNMKRRSEMGR